MFRPYFLNYCNQNENDSIDTIFEDIGCNIGNTYILHSINSILFKTPPKEVYGIKNLFNITHEISTDKIDFINDNFTHIIFNIQDQLRENISYYPDTKLRFTLINKFLEKIHIPIVVFGCGSNTFNYSNRFSIINELCEEQILFCKILSLKSKYISLRGEYTAKIFDDLNIKNYILCGCPSYYIHGMNRLSIYKKNISNIVVTGNFNPHVVNVEKYNITYFLQDINEVNLIGKSDKYFFSSKLDELNNFFKDKDFVIGTRVHGTIIALNNGIPAICMNQDTRAQEMCKLFNIPHINNYTFVTIEELYQNINFDIYNNNYSELYNKFLDFLQKNNIDPNNKVEYNEHELFIKPDIHFIYVYKDHVKIYNEYLYFHTDSYIRTEATEEIYLDETKYKFIHQSSKIRFNTLIFHDDNKNIRIEY